METAFGKIMRPNEKVTFGPDSTELDRAEKRAPHYLKLRPSNPCFCAFFDVASSQATGEKDAGCLADIDKNT